MRRWLLAVAVTLLALAPLSLHAGAAEPSNHPRLETFKMPPPSKVEPLKDPCGVAVTATGRTFVANYYEHALYVFEENPPFHFYFDRIEIDEPPLGPNAGPIDGPCDLAVDAAGNLYFNNYHRNVVRYPSTGELSFGPGTVIDANYSTGVFIDPVSGHVFVDDRTYVAEYDAAGAPVMEGGEPVRIGLGSIEDGYGVAVSGFAGNPGIPSTAGRVYVADASDDTIKVFDPAGDPQLPVEVIDGEGTPQAGFSHLVDSDLAVDPLDGHLYVFDNLQPGFEEPEAVVHEFSSLGHYRGSVPSGVASGQSSNLIHGEPSSVAIEDGKIYLTSGNYFDDEPEFHPSEVMVFGPASGAATRILTVTKTGTGSGRVSSSDPAGLGCGTACDGEFDQGRTVTLLAEPDLHNRFAGWSANCIVKTPQKCTVKIDADAVVTAEFEPIPQRHLTVLSSGGGGGSGTIASIPAGIDCGAVCGEDFDEASAVTLIATPGARRALSGWSGCDSEPGPRECRVTMDAAREVEARFEALPEPPPPPPPPPPGQRILSVLSTTTGGAGGSVTSAPGGIDCGATCARIFGEGETVTLSAHPAPRSRFLGWGGCDRAAGERCIVTLGTDKTVVAAFAPGSPGPLRVRGVVVRGNVATLRLEVPAAGTLSASGRGLSSAEALPLVAGQVSLGIHLSEAGRRALAKARRGRLAIKVALALAPFDGGSVVRTSRSVVFGVRIRKGDR